MIINGINNYHIEILLSRPRVGKPACLRLDRGCTYSTSLYGETLYDYACALYGWPTIDAQFFSPDSNFNGNHQFNYYFDLFLQPIVYPGLIS